MYWSEIKMPGIGGIDRVAEVFQIYVGGALPFAWMKIKIVESADRRFMGVPNVAIRNPASGFPEWIGGSGDSVEDALRDALERFFREIEQNTPGRSLVEADFEWSDPTDF